MGASRDFSSDSYQSFGDTTFLDGVAGYTMACWVNYDTIANDKGSPCGKRTSFGDFTFYHYTNNGHFIIAVRGDASNYLVKETTGLITDFTSTGTWTWIAATVTSGTPLVYFVGISRALTNIDSAGTITALYNSSGAYQVGGFTNSFGMDGKIAYLHLYNRGLSASELDQIMYQPGCIRNGLVSFVPCLDTSTTERDLVQGTTATSGGTNSSNVSGPPIKGVFF